MTSFLLLDNLQVLRDFRHVNPDGDEEAKELQDSNVSIVHLKCLMLLSLEDYTSENVLTVIDLDQEGCSRMHTCSQ